MDSPRHGRRHSRSTPPNSEQELYFTARGYDHSVYFFLQHCTGQIVRIDLHEAPSMESIELMLISLAPLEFWQAKYPHWQGLTTWELAACSLFRQCEAAGVYDPKAAL